MNIRTGFFMDGILTAPLQNSLITGLEDSYLANAGIFRLRISKCEFS